MSISQSIVTRWSRAVRRYDGLIGAPEVVLGPEIVRMLDRLDDIEIEYLQMRDQLADGAIKQRRGDALDHDTAALSKALAGGEPTPKGSRGGALKREIEADAQREVHLEAVVRAAEDLSGRIRRALLADQDGIRSRARAEHEAATEQYLKALDAARAQVEPARARAEKALGLPDLLDSIAHGAREDVRPAQVNLPPLSEAPQRRVVATWQRQLTLEQSARDDEARTKGEPKAAPESAAHVHHPADVPRRIL